MAESPLFELPGRVRPRWSEARATEIRSAIDRRVHRRKLMRKALATSGLTLIGVLFLSLLGARLIPLASSLRLIPGTPTSPQAVINAPVATPLTADTELVVDPQGAGRAYVLRRGSARFVVTHDASQPFRVLAGALIVEDFGTTFSVARHSPARTEVSVEEGSVVARCYDERIPIDAGQRRYVECMVREANGIPNTAASTPLDNESIHPSKANPSTAASKPLARPSPQREPAWRGLAQRGQYAQAYDSLRSEGQSAVRDEVAELLLAADTARLSGHPNDAVPYLRRVLGRHGSDPRAALTAFTLGRVLLDELGRPAEAAAAFERARANSSPLAEDALAREVEALARAGDTQRAHALALDYRRRYPEGRRARVVVKFGGLE